MQRALLAEYFDCVVTHFSLFHFICFFFFVPFPRLSLLSDFCVTPGPAATSTTTTTTTRNFIIYLFNSFDFPLRVATRGERIKTPDREPRKPCVGAAAVAVLVPPVATDLTINQI